LFQAWLSAEFGSAAVYLKAGLLLMTLSSTAAGQGLTMLTEEMES